MAINFLTISDADSSSSKRIFNTSNRANISVLFSLLIDHQDNKFTDVDSVVNFLSDTLYTIYNATSLLKNCIRCIYAKSLWGLINKFCGRTEKSYPSRTIMAPLSKATTR